jgi:hypothetical protein
MPRTDLTMNLMVLLKLVNRGEEISGVKQPLYRPKRALKFLGGWGSQISRQSAHGVVTLSFAFSPISISGCVDPRAHSNDTIKNWSRDLPAWSTVPQPTAPPRTSNKLVNNIAVYNLLSIWNVCRMKYLFCGVTQLTLYLQQVLNIKPTRCREIQERFWKISAVQMTVSIRLFILANIQIKCTRN